MASALRRVAAVLERDLGDIPADPASLAPLLASAHPARIGIRPPRWGRIKSLLRSALAEVGFDLMPGRDIEGLSPAWASLAEHLPRRLHYGLSRFFSHCSRRGIDPRAVDQAVFEGFLEALTRSSLQEGPEALYRVAVNRWNELTASPGRPRLTITPLPDGRRSPLPAESFPASLRSEIEATLCDQSDPDPFADNYRRPLRPATIRGRRQQLYQAARALVDTGLPIASITSLAVLISAENAERILRHLRDRKGGKSTPGLANIAQTLRGLAQRLGAPSADIERLREVAKNLHVPQRGMTERNRERLRQFALPANKQAILRLPNRVWGRAQRVPGTGNSEAVKVMLALAVAILTGTAMRLGNLTGLEMGRHIKRIRHGRHTTYHIYILATEMKAARSFETVLSPETGTLLTAYLEKYRGQIAGPHLFPGRGGARRSEIRFGAHISKFIYRETGLKMNPHLFRHLCGFLYLLRHPDDIETVRQLLGHEDTRTTLGFYAEISPLLAFLKYERVLADERDGLPPGRSRRKTRRWTEDEE